MVAHLGIPDVGLPPYFLKSWQAHLLRSANTLVLSHLNESRLPFTCMSNLLVPAIPLHSVPDLMMSVSGHPRVLAQHGVCRNSMPGGQGPPLSVLVIPDDARRIQWSCTPSVVSVIQPLSLDRMGDQDRSEEVQSLEPGHSPIALGEG